MARTVTRKTASRGPPSRRGPAGGSSARTDHQRGPDHAGEGQGQLYPQEDAQPARPLDLVHRIMNSLRVFGVMDSPALSWVRCVHRDEASGDAVDPTAMEGGAYGARVPRAQASGAPSHRPACGAQASVSPAPWTIARRLARLTRDDHETGSEGCYRKSVARLTIRVDLGKGGALGPGKIRLLELIDARGSISEAGRAMGMSYRRAWLLVDNLNRSFRDSAVAKQTGGPQGGGARLTPWGRRLVERYRAIETDAAQAVAPHLRVLASARSGRRLGTPRRLAPSARRSRRPRPATR